MPTFIKEGAHSSGFAINGVPREFIYPYTTEDPKEISALRGIGATEVTAKPVELVEPTELTLIAPRKKEVMEDKGGEQ